MHHYVKLPRNAHFIDRFGAVHLQQSLHQPLLLRCRRPTRSVRVPRFPLLGDARFSRFSRGRRRIGRGLECSYRTCAPPRPRKAPNNRGQAPKRSATTWERSPREYLKSAACLQLLFDVLRLFEIQRFRENADSTNYGIPEIGLIFQFFHLLRCVLFFGLQLLGDHAAQCRLMQRIAMILGLQFPDLVALA